MTSLLKFRWFFVYYTGEGSRQWTIVKASIPLRSDHLVYRRTLQAFNFNSDVTDATHEGWTD